MRSVAKNELQEEYFEELTRFSVSLDGFNVVAAYNLCDAATFLKTILGSYW